MGSDIELEGSGGTIDGRYAVEAWLGDGGSAAVYRVRDSRDGRALALKRPRAEDAHAARRRRASLEREYYLLAELRHPSIIEVYDYGVDDEGPYYTMELLDGADVETRGRRAWRDACALLRDVASSLAVLHSRGLIHRDVSSRNVRGTAAGAAKLIDFGSMTSIGVAGEVVGTPPFMAPEVLQLQTLDGRADLFSLGALAYYVLSGRHAFPARNLDELGDLWRSRPLPLSRAAPDLPSALEALVFELLTLDRAARPESAAVVMERLCAIAELPLLEASDVSRAYLTTPALVGREQVRLAIRRRMLRLPHHEGSALLITGSAGSGRSRLLDTCALEAKLLGAQVARADANDACDGDFGAARALIAQLFELLPGDAARAARRCGTAFHELLLARDGHAAPGADSPDRGLALRDARDFVRAVARAGRVLLVCDDIDHFDEASLALIAALTDNLERHALVLALTAHPGGERESASLHLCRTQAQILAIEALSREETGALLRSLFGEAQNLEQWLAHVYALSEGKPAAVIELAHDLLNRGIARYEAGSWLLSPARGDADLPASLRSALQHRLDALSDDARELGELLALGEGDGLPLSAYVAASSHDDSGRTFRAFDALVAARFAVLDGERGQLRQRALSTLLLSQLPEAQACHLHARLAAVLAQAGGDVTRRVHHLLLAEKGEEAIALLADVDLDAQALPLRLLEAAVACAERHAAPARLVCALRMQAVTRAQFALAAECFQRQLPPLVARLSADSGLALYETLEALPPAERLTQSLSRAQAAFLATPEHARVDDVPTAIRKLARLSAVMCGTAVTLFDLELLDSLPSLGPFLSLSPGLQIVERLLEAGREWIRGRALRSEQIYEQVLSSLTDEPPGLDAREARQIVLGVQYSLALVEASIGVEQAEERAKFLERHRGMRVNAWRVRMLLNFSRGDLMEGRRCLRRAELLELQDSASAHYSGTSAGFELMACAYVGDLLGAKAAVEALAALAREHAGWRPMWLHGLACYYELRGDLPRALEAVAGGLELAPPGRHLAFGLLAPTEVRLLCRLGRLERALERGHEHLASCKRESLAPADRIVEVELSQALARAGQTSAALEMIEDALGWCEARGATGVFLGQFYEARARIAIAAGDAAGYARYVERYSQALRGGDNPGLRAKLARLAREAEQAGLPCPTPSELPEQAAVRAAPLPCSTFSGRIGECIDRTERARCALVAVLESVGGDRGYLYGVEDDGVSLIAALPGAPDDTLAAYVRRRLSRELASETPAARRQDPNDKTTADHACRYAAMVLGCQRQGEPRIAAVLVLPHALGRPPATLLNEIAAQLLDHEDVRGAKAAVAATTRED